MIIKMILLIFQLFLAKRYAHITANTMISTMLADVMRREFAKDLANFILPNAFAYPSKFNDFGKARESRMIALFVLKLLSSTRKKGTRKRINSRIKIIYNIVCFIVLDFIIPVPPFS
jgi:hypothetical protein